MSHDHRTSLVTRILEVGRRHPEAPPSSTAEEPCVGCGEETAVGSVFFSDRRAITRSDGARVYLCSDCQSRAHRSRKGEPLSDEDLRTIADNGMMVGAGFLGGGGIGGL